MALQERTESEWDQLLDPAGVAKDKSVAERQWANLSKEQYHKLRVRAKRDLFFIAYGILGYNRLSAKHLHGHLCRWMEETKHERFRLILLPRNHFKSTIVTISDSIRIVLPYTDEDRKYDPLADVDPLPWPEQLGTECRLMIAHETQEGASRYLFSIIHHFLHNPLLMGLFPEAIPNPRDNRINKKELQLPRNSPWSEPTIDTLSSGAKGQGRHYNKIKLDDIIGENARDSPTEMQTSKDWIDNIQAFFSTFSKDTMDINGTRWANDDTYQHIIERYGKQIRVYRRPVEEINQATGLKEPIFPEEFTTEGLNILRKNRKVFSAQYENDPDSGSTKFNPDTMKWFGWQDRYRITVFGTKLHKVIRLRDLYTSFLIDPAVSGFAGFNIVGTDSIWRNFVLASIQREWRPSELVDYLFRQVQVWHPDVVIIEKVLFSELYKPWVELEQKVRGINFRIELADTKQKSKEYRVDKLESYLSAGQLFFNEQYYSKEQDPEEKYSDLIYQVRKYGTIKHIHLLDALAYGPDVWRPGIPRERIEEQKKQSEELLQARAVDTGYSEIA